jgi:TetR/AcrR family transcriptional regulator, transcriptional repressor for nem operon
MPKSRPASVSDNTADKILDVAERLIQTKGFNAFSYADIAAELVITKASLHYHFATKATLGFRLVERYTKNFERALRAIDDRDQDSVTKLRAYVGLYEGVLRKGRMCLCGMLAADFETLSNETHKRLHAFFDMNEAWVADVLEAGRGAKQLQFSGSGLDEARHIVSGLEGAMLIARSYGDPARLSATASHIIASLVLTKPSKRAARGK